MAGEASIESIGAAYTERPLKLFSLEGLVRNLADEQGVFEVTSLASFLVGDEAVPIEDIKALEDEVRELSKGSEDIRSLGEGLFAILPISDKPPQKPRSNVEDRRRLDRMMTKEFGPPRVHLPRNKRARQKALRRLKRS